MLLVSAMKVDKYVYDSLPDPIVLLGEDRSVIYANTAAQELLECRPEGGDIALSVRHPVVIDAIDRLREGAKNHAAEVSFPIPVERSFQLYAIRPEAKKIESGQETKEKVEFVKFILLFRDITLAARAEKMRVDFVANASHELRSPLAALHGFVETLKGSASEDKVAREHFLDIMERESHRMRRLLDDLLSLSRVEENEHIRPRDQVDVSMVLSSALDILQMRAAERDMEICINLPDDLPLIIGDVDQLIQVFRNLTENAINYGRESSKINVSAETIVRIPESGNRGVAIHVRDFGEGIDNELIPRLTERFYRVDRARSRSDTMSSTGLGLAIVKHIVARHRGNLAIQSTIGEGSIFSVYLPIE